MIRLLMDFPSFNKRPPGLPVSCPFFRLPGLVYLCITFLLSVQPVHAQQNIYTNPSVSIEKRVEDLLSRLTIDEKIALLSYDSPGVPRLNIPKYNWWNEALHGVARAGKATVFPQAIALAASFDDSLVRTVANVISDEARAKYNAAVRNGNRSQYLGLTFWSPNINIFRDPRWGRGHETYGEDPYLTGRIGTAFVKGLQGNDPRYYKAVACAKHFAVHSGPEPLRHEFNAQPSEEDLRNTYLPAFRQLVKAGVGGVMCAYNRMDSLPCCTSTFLLQDILRKEWGFKGYVVTDCWALDDIVGYHHFVKTREEASALAIKAGVNVECGNALGTLKTALDKGLLNDKDIDASLRINLEILFKLGLFDPKGMNPYDKIGEDVVDNAAHQELAKKAAVTSMVLLSNKNNILPLRNDLHSILVTGPNADDHTVLLANYNGLSGNQITILEGITNAIGPATSILYNKGCELTDTSRMELHWMGGSADVIVAVMGLSPLMEGENGDAYLSEAGGDKKDISFPFAQLKYLRALKEKMQKPLVVVIAAGSAVELAEVESIADAVLLCWYPGEQGGNAVADVLFGKADPGGRLPVTFYRSNKDLPPFEDYSMQGRTYRYFKGIPTHPFGFGLSYASIGYGKATHSEVNGLHKFKVFLINKTNRDGTVVLQLYAARKNAGPGEAVEELKNFKKVYIKKGEDKEVELELKEEDLATWDTSAKKYLVRKGDYKISIGENSKDVKVSFNINVK